MSFKLRSYQEEPAEILYQLASDKEGTGGDLSDMGTGKTFVACEVIRRLNTPTLVVCPKTARAAWEDVGQQVGAEFSVINWEMLRTGRTPYGTFQKVGRGSRFVWAPEVKAVFFDEIHQAGGLTSLNSKLVIGARATRKKAFGLTATPAESPLQMKALGYLLGLHNGVEFWQWCLNNGCYKAPFGGLGFTQDPVRSKAIMACLNAQIEKRSVRVRISELGDQFPDVIYSSPLITIDESEEVERLHEQAAEAYRRIKEQGLKGGSEDHPMTQFLRARQKIEILKLPGYIEQAHSALSSGHKVFFFVNFSATIAALKAKFPSFGVIDGQTKDRQSIIEAVQSDKLLGCILNNEAGGVAISLHDITGKHPCYSIISPPVKAKSFRQVTGRTRRNGSLTVPHICVPVVAGTCEVKIKKRIDMRLDNNDVLCDGDLNYDND